MTDFAKKTRIPVLIATVALCLSAVVLRTVLLLFRYEPALGHFVSDVWSDLFFPLIFVLALVIFSFYAFLLRGAKADEVERGGIPTLFSSAFGIVATLVWVFTLLVYVIRTPRIVSQSLNPIGTVLGFLLCAAAFGLIAFFVFRLLPNAHPAAPTVTAFAAVFFCLIYAFFAYFDTAFTLNSPIKIFDQMTAVALALLFLLECRRTVGKDSVALRLPLSLLCMVLTAANSIPNLIYAGVTGLSVYHSVMHDFLALAFFLYVTATAIPLLSALNTAAIPDTAAVPPVPEDELPALPDDPSDFEIPTEDLIRLSENRGDAPFDATSQGTTDFDPTLH